MKKTHSEVLQDKNDINTLEKNKSLQPENGQETAEKLLARKEEAAKSMKVIRKQSDYYNNIESHNYPSDKKENKKETTYTTGEGSQHSNYVPKRIITKEQGKYGNSFKTYPDGARTTSNVKYVNNEKKTQNVAEYRNNRIFKNEDLNKHQIYYYNYGGNKDQSKLAKNNNVIPKGNY